MKKIKEVINADGRMTILGVSRISNSVSEAIKYAGENFFIMSEFKELLNNEISKIIKSKNVCIVNSASAGIALSIASIIYEDKIHDVNRNVPVKNEIILLKGQNIDFGAPIEDLVYLVGGKPIEAGYSNRCSEYDLKYRINNNTAALLYVVSHHCVQKNMISLNDVIKISKETNIPIIVDCAAEEDIWKYSSLEIDAVIFSGSKAIEGPTSGLIFGTNQKLIDNSKKHLNNIGRVMKIGKENMYGLYQALIEYKMNKDIDIDKYFEIFDNSKYWTTNISIDSRNIKRIELNMKNNKINAVQLSQELKNGEIAIFLRDYLANQETLEVDLRNISSEDAKLIRKKMTEILGG